MAERKQRSCERKRDSSSCKHDLAEAECALFAGYLGLLICALGVQGLVALYAKGNLSGHTAMTPGFFALFPLLFGAITIPCFIISSRNGLRVMATSVFLAAALGALFPYWLSHTGILLQYDAWAMRSDLEVIRPANANARILVYFLSALLICAVVFVIGSHMLFRKDKANG